MPENTTNALATAQEINTVLQGIRFSPLWFEFRENRKAGVQLALLFSTGFIKELSSAGENLLNKTRRDLVRAIQFNECNHLDSPESWLRMWDYL